MTDSGVCFCCIFFPVGVTQKRGLSYLMARLQTWDALEFESGVDKKKTKKRARLVKHVFSRGEGRKAACSRGSYPAPHHKTLHHLRKREEKKSRLKLFETRWMWFSATPPRWPRLRKQDVLTGSAGQRSCLLALPGPCWSRTACSASPCCGRRSARPAPAPAALSSPALEPWGGRHKVGQWGTLGEVEEKEGRRVRRLTWLKGGGGWKWAYLAAVWCWLTCQWFNSQQPSMTVADNRVQLHKELCKPDVINLAWANLHPVSITRRAAVILQLKLVYSGYLD